MTRVEKCAVALYVVATMVTAVTAALAVVLNAPVVALGIFLLWLCGWNPIIALLVAQLVETRTAQKAELEPAQTSVGRHRADQLDDQAPDGFVEMVLAR
jgi:hypothetical protein